MAYNNGGTIMPYPQQGNGYTLQPVPNFNQRPNNVRKVGKHEDEEAGKLFVGGLSWDTTQESLLSYFSRFGDVIDCVVMKNSNTNRSRGFGFVTFADPSKIEAVLANCPHSLDGRTIDPKACNPRSMQKPKKSNGYPKVFLGGLPSTITETDLRSFFSKYGEVCEVVIMYDQEKKKSRGFGFLSFETEAARERAVAEHFVMIQNKQVEIKRAEPRTFHINGTAVKEQQQMPDQATWAGGGGAPLQNGHAHHAQHQVLNQVPPPNNWTPQLPSPGASYPPQYGSPPMAAAAQWNQPPPPQPTPPAAPHPQWTTYASPPPSNSYYPANAPAPSYWAPAAHQSEQTQFSQKVYGQYAPAAAPQPVNPATGHGQPATTPSYPTQYPNIPKAQYNAPQPTPAEFYTTSMGAPGAGINSPPMVGYPPCSLAPAAALATAAQPRLFTPQQQPVTSSQSYHPYRRQP